MITVVLAGNRSEAVAHCKELDIPPHGRDTVIVSGPRSLPGLRLTRDDKVLVCRRFYERRDAWEVIRALERSCRTGGFTSTDIREDIEC